MEMLKIHNNPPRREWPALTARCTRQEGEITERVAAILSQVRTGGDKALRDLVARIEGYVPERFEVSRRQRTEAAKAVPQRLKTALAIAKSNIEAFHRAQLPPQVDIEVMPGVRCVQRAVAIGRVGLYIPGGNAPLFSTVLMLALPARIAGCGEVVLCTPAGRGGKIAPEVLFAADLCGVDRIFAVGGAQAVAAMAYGTESIPHVEKIFGPGNRYVTRAKQLVSAEAVAVDLPAGPSEVMVLADNSARAEFVAADLLSLALLKAPGEWGADIAVGSAQRLGTPMGFGGPAAGYMTTREAFKRNMPGRIIGVSVDRLGNKALRMALQMREQHIKRERATSNICTASALMASMTGFYCVYNGPEGLRRAAETAHLAAATVARALEAMDYRLASKEFFDTLEVEAEAAVVQSLALEQGINFYYPSEGRVRMSFDEVTTAAEIETVVSIFAAAKGKKAKAVKAVTESCVPTALRRQSPYLQEPVFNAYRSESALMRYIKKLELRDISLANSMISLGSCTMKLNAAALMQPLSLAGFQMMHPFAPADQAEGYMQLIKELENDLATITGFAACSLQPNSGAAGEYAGLMVIRAYHQSRGQGYRNVVLIPASAHGTNPASAAMAGMKIVTVACDERGNIDVADLEAKAKEHSSELCGLMVTYPSTHGVFESRIREIVDAVHDAGGQVYMDGANMNAQVGLTNPGYIGADVCHLNLHKTFAMPHGGGGPGVGPICVAEHLRAFLPSHPVVATGGDEGITAVASAPWGSALLFPITYGYIKMLGAEGLRRATEMAIVNANYMSAALAAEYRTYYSGETGRVGHEMILDLTSFKKDYNIDCGDIAHRLMDYGFHAPTLSFPVHETLMVEPTESEPKEEMDRFIEALISIKRECEAAAGQADNVVANAPHTARELAGAWEHPYSRDEAAFPLAWIGEAKFFPYVSKIDNGYGDRNLCCRNCE